jgi:hypothetical protein
MGENVYASISTPFIGGSIMTKEEKATTSFGFAERSNKE